ncbi:TPA: hypothetical protein N2N50_004155 [Kluyvera ascorbata]|nr:hypothetical protein [uncultured Kluyvera sp.]BBV65566.1 hypothetical protein STW0522KLE44_19540 [Klebsiella sp. STW0522-44]HAT7516558.1 hypothetical protein [Kluyvera ascorbata]HCL5623105.1 hypothetical protein [Kluyvera ascorbata]HDG1665741.1 hypothetical protein [Kluyvera ascorbata]HED3203562.1 hypothetical protein [Kluyvera ascorbata]
MFWQHNVLYSGVLGEVGSTSEAVSIVRASDIVNDLKNNPDIRLIDKTEASAFLSNPALDDILFQIFGDDRYNVGSKSNQFLFGEIIDGVRQPNGAWDIISQRFVAETTGEVRLLVGMNTDPTRVFGAVA